MDATTCTISAEGGIGMKANEITVEVKAKLEVSRSTAEACLKLVEVYANEHPEVMVMGERNEDGTHRFEIIDKEKV